MKIRTAFVSNSSSASFVVKNVHKLTPKQIDMIMNHDKYLAMDSVLKQYYDAQETAGEYVEKYNPTYDYWPPPKYEGDAISDFTSMENMCMKIYLLKVVGVHNEDLEFESDNDY